MKWDGKAQAIEDLSSRWLLYPCLGLLIWACGEPGDPLASRGIAVTSGAAAGYVPDTVCASCHGEIYGSYQEVGMARSFYRPRQDRLIEDFPDEPFFHAPSQRYYRMHRDGETLRFERYQLDGAGQPIHRFEVEVDWILGSGHTSRTYLFHTPGGELYQLPIAWYTQPGRWGMAPGFDRPDHFGVERLVRRECMFCHNAYPEVAEGSDVYGQPHHFPTDLPEGIGCQRCHGPGAEHVRAAIRGDGSTAAAIVDPGELTQELAADVCYGCHFQPSVSLMGVRRFGRATYSFRPGEPLTDYLALLDVDEEGQSREGRFEINHHPYRLEQSTCFRRSEPGELTCTRCHDPHRKVPAEERQAHYRAACLSCHQLEACSLPRSHPGGASPMVERGRGSEQAAQRAKRSPKGGQQAVRAARAGTPASLGTDMTEAQYLAEENNAAPPIEAHFASDSEAHGLPDVATDDCVACHMPRRRTQDVVQVVMTDHNIQRRPGGSELLAPLQEKTPILTGAELIRPTPDIPHGLAEVYKASAVTRAGGSAEASRFLALALDAMPEAPAEPRLDLIQGLLGLGRFAEAEAVANETLERWPELAQARNWRAIARIPSGKPEEALADLERSLAEAGERPEPLFNQGLVLCVLHRFEEAVVPLRRAVELRPNFPKAWAYLGRALLQLQEVDAAEDAFRRSLSIDPTDSRVTIELARILAWRQQPQEALRILEHGSRHTRRPQDVGQALAELRRELATGP